MFGLTLCASKRTRADGQDDDDDATAKPALLRPLGNGTDDWPTLLSTAAALAYKAPIILLPGLNGESWSCQSSGMLPSGTTIIGTPNVLVQMSMTAAGHQANVAFYAAPSTAGNDGALASDVAVGTTVLELSLASSPTVGQAVQITNGTTGAVYDILSVSGNTVVVDRPVMFPFRAGDPISVLASYPSDIRIIGNGMRITGTGDRCVELIAADRCRVEELAYDTSGGCVSDSVMSLDIAGHENAFVRCSVDLSGGADTVHGILLESQDSSHILGCTVRQAPYVALYMVDSYGCSVVDCKVTNASIGLWLGTDAGLGNFDCRAEGVTIAGGSLGLGSNKALRTSLRRCSISGQSDAGISLAATVDTEIEHCQSTNNSRGLIVWTGAASTVVRDLDVSDSQLGGVIAVTDIAIDGLTANVARPQTIVSLGGSSSSLTSFGLTSSITVTAVRCSGSVRLEHGSFALPTDSVGIHVVDGTTRIADVVGKSANYGAYVASGATLRRGESTDLGACNYPVYAEKGAYFTSGLVTANGTAGVDVEWPGIADTDLISLVRISGTATTLPTITTVPGTKFVLFAQDGDTGTYQYDIRSA